MHCRMISSIPGFNLLDVHHTPPTQVTTQVSTLCQMSPMGQNYPYLRTSGVENNRNAWNSENKWNSEAVEKQQTVQIFLINKVKVLVKKIKEIKN